MSPNDNNNEFPPGEGGESDAPLNTGRPAVASAPGKVMVVVLLAGLFIFIIVKSIFFSEKVEPKQVVAHRKESVTAEGSHAQNELSISTGSLPTPPSMEMANTATMPPPPPPPPPPPALLTPPSPEMHAAGVNDEALNKRIHSPMLAVNGAGAKPADTSQAKHSAAIPESNDPNSAFAQSVSQSQTSVVEAGKISNLSVTIAQGKLVHAILETAIDSSLPGPIRAIVSHDTYAEAGKAILIPKGSRLIGNYNAAIRRGQSRVFIVWERIIRPDGIDIMIDSPGADALGRAGMTGEVDNKYFEVFSGAIMTSALDIGVAAVGDALFGNQQTTTTNNGTGSSTTQSPTSTAMQTAVQNISNVGNGVVNNALNTTPTIYIDQGTPVDILVNKDLLFPYGIASSSSFIQ